MTYGTTTHLATSIALILYVGLVSWGAMDNSINDELASPGGVTMAATAAVGFLFSQVHPAATLEEVIAIGVISIALGIAYTKLVVEPLVEAPNPLPVRFMDGLIDRIFPTET